MNVVDDAITAKFCDDVLLRRRPYYVPKRRVTWFPARRFA